jgi:hypothetical protein
MRAPAPHAAARPAPCGHAAPHALGAAAPPQAAGAHTAHGGGRRAAAAACRCGAAPRRGAAATSALPPPTPQPQPAACRQHARRSAGGAATPPPPTRRRGPAPLSAAMFDTLQRGFEAAWRTLSDADDLSPVRRGGAEVARARARARLPALTWRVPYRYVTRAQANMKAPLRELRTALLEADVALPVVKEFLAKVEAAAAGVQARTRTHTHDGRIDSRLTCTPRNATRWRLA